ncbi:hypothetical protein ISP17_13435 [Dyella ginsengisoli]|uniref:Uncharacterized protein n=1 Tax=Dyella ginsengisoli TaxID=363848 RepID=A0ABW8JVR1_9GAMM
MKNKLRNIRAPLALSLALMAGAASAQTSAPDTSSVVSTITGALAAIAAIGAAWVGFKYLKKVWNKL